MNRWRWLRLSLVLTLLTNSFLGGWLWHADVSASDTSEEILSVADVNRYGGNSDVIFTSISPSQDEGYIAVGSNGYLALIVKYDKSGNQIWQQDYGVSGPNLYSSVISLQDGGYIAVGRNASRDALIVKYSSSGTLLWDKSYGGGAYEEYSSVVSSPDGGIIAVGYSASTDGDLVGLNKTKDLQENKWYREDAILVKYDKDGNIVWKRNFGGNMMDYFLHVAASYDGGYVVVGYSCSTDGDMSGISAVANDAIIVKYDDSGKVIWKRSYGTNLNDKFYRITSSSDGGYVVLGNVLNEYVFVKYDDTGNRKWIKTANEIGFSSEYTISDIQMTEDGTYVATGYDDSVTLLKKFDETSRVYWTNFFSDANYRSRFNTFLLGTTGGYVAVGQSLHRGDRDRNYKSEGLVVHFNVAVSGISLNQTELELRLHETVRLLASVLPYSASNKSVRWTSSNSNVATVSSGGQIQAVGIGETTITVTTEEGYKQASARVTVIPNPVNGVTLDKTVLDLATNETIKLSATVTPSDAINKKVTWSSTNRNVVNVDASGLVTALKPGSAVITVTTDEGEFKDSVQVTVKNLLADSITLTPTSITLEKDKIATIQAKLLPDKTSDKSIEWTSSNTEVAIVSSKGVVKALRKGTVTITALNRASLQSAKATVTVYGKIYTDVEDVYDLANPAVAYIEAYDANNKLVSTASGFLISSDGRLVTNLHAILNGTSPIAYVKAIFPDKSYNNITTVLGYDGTNDIAILKINGVSNLPYLDLADPSELRTGQKVVAIGSPEKLENSLTLGVVSSRMRKIADTVYIQTDVGISNGSSGGVLLNMKGEAVGITTAGFGVPSANLNLAIPIESLKVVATNNPKTLSDIKDVQIVTVEGIKKYSLKTIVVTSVKFNTSTLTLAPKHTNSLVATVSPSNASNKNVTYTSSNTKVATVDVNGKVTAVAAGTASITVKTKDGNKSAIVSVTVTTPVTSVTLNKSTLSLTAKQTSPLTATINPTTATNKNVTWTSSNTKVATVDANGKVTAVAKGTTTITVKTTDGNKTATCVVTVK